MVWHVRDSGMCVVGKMAKDIGMAIRVVPTLFGYFFEIPSLHTSSLFKCFFCDLFLLLFGGGGGGGGEGEKFLCRDVLM